MRSFALRECRASARVARMAALALVALPLGSGLGCAGLTVEDLAQIALQTGPLDETTVASGLREALRVGSGRAANSLSQTGGFSEDPLLRLALPDQLDPLARTMRSVGFGAQVDELELAMNRAAEAAAGQAVPVFATAVSSMTLEDAFAILNGPDDAATQYFQRATSDELRSRFAPVVQRAMGQVGLYDAYRQLISRYEAVPFAKQLDLDLEGHVADRTLDGLFGALAEEERRIREDPAAVRRRCCGASSDRRVRRRALVRHVRTRCRSGGELCDGSR